jgi:hypothetical protein
MATKTWNLRQVATGGTPANILWWDPSNATAPAQATSASGWTVGKIAANNYSNLVAGSESATGTFSTTIVPNTTAPVATGSFAATATYTPPTLLYHTNSITTLYEYNGYFPAGNWIFTFNVISVSTAATGAGRINLRVFKGTRNGTAFSNVTELTAAMQAGTIASAPTTTVTRASTVTWAAPAIRLDNQFLIVKVGWQITTASGSNTADILLRHGTGCTMVSPTFRERQYNIN